MRYSPMAPIHLTLEVFPISSRRVAVVTFAAACGSRPSNQLPYGFEPSSRTYSTTVNLILTWSHICYLQGWFRHGLSSKRRADAIRHLGCCRSSAVLSKTRRERGVSHRTARHTYEGGGSHPRYVN